MKTVSPRVSNKLDIVGQLPKKPGSDLLTAVIRNLFFIMDYFNNGQITNRQAELNKAMDETESFVE